MPSPVLTLGGDQLDDAAINNRVGRAGKTGRGREEGARMREKEPGSGDPAIKHIISSSPKVGLV